MFEKHEDIEIDTFDDEMDKKYGVSGKLANVKAWEVDRLIDRIRNEYVHDDCSEYIRTGFNEFDNCIKGFRRGETYLLAARPSMGKTAFALSLLGNLIREPINRILYVSLNESRATILLRFLKQMAGIENIDVAAEVKEKWQYLVKSVEKLEVCGELIFIDDRQGISVNEIFEDCEQMGGVDFIIVDYLQLVQEIGYDELPSYEKFALICEDLSLLAKVNNCAVLILSQLSRAVEGRKNHMPTKEDVVRLVPGRSVDNVIFLKRDDYYDRDSEKKGLAEFYFAKRNGAGDTKDWCELGWLATQGKFRNLVRT